MITDKKNEPVFPQFFHAIQPKFVFFLQQAGRYIFRREGICARGVLMQTGQLNTDFIPGPETENEIW